MIMFSEASKPIPRNSSIWVQEWLAEMDSLSAYHTILQEFRLRSAEHYWKYLRMNVETFEFLLDKLRPIITKKTTILCVPISTEEQLAITLRYLATGESFFSLMTQFRVSQASIGQIVLRVCQAIIDLLMNEFMPFPKTPDEWEKIAENYQEKLNFPNCIGALDRKHVAIIRPDNSVSEYFNYKGFYSIILYGIG